MDPHRGRRGRGLAGRHPACRLDRALRDAGVHRRVHGRRRSRHGHRPCPGRRAGATAGRPGPVSWRRRIGPPRPDPPRASPLSNERRARRLADRPTRPGSAAELVRSARADRRMRGPGRWPGGRRPRDDVEDVAEIRARGPPSHAVPRPSPPRSRRAEASVGLPEAAREIARPDVASERRFTGRPGLRPAQPDGPQSILARDASRSVISYSAVTAWPAPMAPASTRGSRKSRSAMARFSYPMSRYDATTSGSNSTCDLGVERDRLERPGQVLDEQAVAPRPGR